MALTIILEGQANLGVTTGSPATITLQLGTPGPAGTIQVGSVETGIPGSDATVVNVGTLSNAIFDFTIPRGNQGIQGERGLQGVQGIQGVKGDTGSAGASATINVGTTTTGSAGTYASVSNSGSTSAAVFNFTIPRGDVGATGATGAKGDKGDTGAGVPTGGSTGQALVKVSGSNYDTTWASINSATWGNITGTLSSQTDLQSALDSKIGINEAFDGNIILQYNANISLGENKIIGNANDGDTGSWTLELKTSTGLDVTQSNSADSYSNQAHYGPNSLSLSEAVSGAYTTLDSLGVIINDPYGTANSTNLVAGYLFLHDDSGPSNSVYGGSGFSIAGGSVSCDSEGIQIGGGAGIQIGGGTLNIGSSGFSFLASPGGISGENDTFNSAGTSDQAYFNLNQNYVKGGWNGSGTNASGWSFGTNGLTFINGTNQTTAFPPAGGTTSQYIDGTGSLQTFPTVSSVGKMVTSVYNNTGATIPKGSVVYINGKHGQEPTIALAKADAEATSAYTIGVTEASIANNSSGNIVTAGTIENLATNAYSDGTPLYLSATTAGALTATKQFAPYHYVKIGTVINANPTAGTIFIKVENGYQLDELSDCAVTAPANNNVLTYESSTSLWKDKSVSTALGYAPANQTLSNLTSSSTARTNLGLAYATDAQVIAGTSASTVITPSLATSNFLNWTVCGTSGLATATSVGTVSTSSYGSRCSLTATTAGQYAIVYPANGSISVFSTSGTSYTDCNFSKRIKIYGRIYVSPQANLNCYYAWGRSNNTPSTIGNPAAKGFGIRIQGTGAVELQVHNGTTLSNVTSSFTPTSLVVFDCLIDSIGDGNVNLYINGGLVATSSGGPTGTGAASFPLLIQEISSTASSSAGAFYVTGKAIYMA